MTDRIHLQGGFGEKGRTSVCIDDGQSVVMLDAGIRVDGGPHDYHPRLARSADGIDALVITHAHEDHIGALCWMLSQGFRGQVYMTPSTRAEMRMTLEQYARPEDLTDFPVTDDRIELFRPGDSFGIGSQTIRTGHSGHVAGGVWLHVSSCNQRTLYCGDVQPDSTAFPFTSVLEADLAILDCSYGTDRTDAAIRSDRILGWVKAHKGGCVLPTPLAGRSIELMILLPDEIAVVEGMKDALRQQIADRSLLRPGVSETVSARIDRARDWRVGSELPDCPLLVHDGMGAAGPASDALAQAERTGQPVLLTGHLPAGSPGQRMFGAGSADWLRYPTHPVLSQNMAIWEAAGRPALLGHSCDAAALMSLGAELPGLNVTARTGDTIRDVRRT